MTFPLQADNFTLNADTTVEAIRFWAFLIEWGSYSGSITWQIRGDASGSPGPVLFSDTVPVTPVDQGPLHSHSIQLRFDINTGAIFLPAGAYWLALHHGPLSNNAWEWLFWQTTVPGAAPVSHHLYEDSWAPNGADEFAFQLFDTPFGIGEIPEPSAWVLMSAGIGLLALRRRC
jgi:hypothetical protein